MHYVYLLREKGTNRIYTGETKDLKQRIAEHAKGTTATTARSNWELDWYCAFTTKEKAQEFEKYLKSGAGVAFRNKRLLS